MGGKDRLGPGTLYGAIKRLKEGGVIEESGERPDPGEAPDDERRRYYRLTGFGGEVLAAEVERLDGLVRAARRDGANTVGALVNGTGLDPVRFRFRRRPHPRHRPHVCAGSEEGGQ